MSDLQSTWTRQRLVELQGEDPAIAVIREWLEEGVELTRDLLLPYGPEVKTYTSQWGSLVIIDGVV